MYNEGFIHLKDLGPAPMHFLNIFISFQIYFYLLKRFLQKFKYFQEEILNILQRLSFTCLVLYRVHLVEFPTDKI